MKKMNWIMQGAEKGWYLSGEDDPHWEDEYDFDDWGYGEEYSVSIGDEIEGHHHDHFMAGVVVGIIRNSHDDPVCYKVWTRTEKYAGAESGFFDYISVDDVTLAESCGSSERALARIGYEKVEIPVDEDDDRIGYYINRDTGDVIAW